MGAAPGEAWSQQADVWALACTLLFLFGGEAPWAGLGPLQIVRKVRVLQAGRLGGAGRGCHSYTGWCEYAPASSCRPLSPVSWTVGAWA